LLPNALLLNGFYFKELTHCYNIDAFLQFLMNIPIHAEFDILAISLPIKLISIL